MYYIFLAPVSSQALGAFLIVGVKHFFSEPKTFQHNDTNSRLFFLPIVHKVCMPFSFTVFLNQKVLKGRSIRTILWISENSKSALNEFCWKFGAARNTHDIYQFQIFASFFHDEFKNNKQFNKSLQCY